MPRGKEDKVFVISCKEDRGVCKKPLEAGIPVVSAEVLLTGILRQELNLEEYPFFYGLIIVHCSTSWYNYFCGVCLWRSSFIIIFCSVHSSETSILADCKGSILMRHSILWAVSNTDFYYLREREMQKRPSQTLSAGIFILYCNPDLNYLKMNCQIHLKIQPAQVEQTKEGESNQKLLPHHLWLKKNHPAQNEGKNEQFIYCHSFMQWNNVKEVTHSYGCIIAISQCMLKWFVTGDVVRQEVKQSPWNVIVQVDVSFILPGLFFC